MFAVGKAWLEEAGKLLLEAFLKWGWKETKRSESMEGKLWSFKYEI